MSDLECSPGLLAVCRGHLQDFSFLCPRIQNQQWRLTPSSQVSSHQALSTKFPQQTSVQQVRYILTRGTNFSDQPDTVQKLFSILLSYSIQSLTWKQEETPRYWRRPMMMLMICILILPKWNMNMTRSTTRMPTKSPKPALFQLIHSVCYFLMNVLCCLCLHYNIIFIARSRNPLLQKSVQSLRQKFSLGASSVRAVGIVLCFTWLFYLFIWLQVLHDLLLVNCIGSHPPAILLSCHKSI